MTNLLDLDELISVGAGTANDWQTGLVTVVVPGVVDVTVLPGLDATASVLQHGLLGSDSALGSILSDVDNGFSTLLDGSKYPARRL